MDKKDIELLINTKYNIIYSYYYYYIINVYSLEFNGSFGTIGSLSAYKGIVKPFLRADNKRTKADKWIDFNALKRDV